jgi:hypothetical protein
VLTKYYLGGQIKKNEGVHVVHMGERTDAYTVVVGKPEGKQPLGRHRYKDNIK